VTRDSAPTAPETVPVAEGRALLAEAKFIRDFIGVAQPRRFEMWHNRFEKIVVIEFSDNTFESYWADSLKIALAQKDAQPTKL
jgi:hypothetical protein